MDNQEAMALDGQSADSGHAIRSLEHNGQQTQNGSTVTSSSNETPMNGNMSSRNGAHHTTDSVPERRSPEMHQQSKIQSQISSSVPKGIEIDTSRIKIEPEALVANIKQEVITGHGGKYSINFMFN